MYQVNAWPVSRNRLRSNTVFTLQFAEGKLIESHTGQKNFARATSLAHLSMIGYANDEHSMEPTLTNHQTPPSTTRRSDRISIEIPIEISGDDIKGFTFLEKTRTAVISRHGAKVFTRYKLARDQELVVRCLSTGKESEARIVGELGAGPEGHAYGIEFLKHEVNVWDIEFPALSQADQVAGRTLLECARCSTRELVYLDAMEVEVLETGLGLSRLCKRCKDTTVWKVASASPAGDPSAQPAESTVGDVATDAQVRTQNERKDARVSAKVSAVIRHPHLGDEIVTSENVSPGGICVRSIRRYQPGTMVEVAFPYTPGGAKVFVAARIVHENLLPDKKSRLYGLEYISAQTTPQVK